MTRRTKKLAGPPLPTQHASTNGNADPIQVSYPSRLIMMEIAARFESAAGRNCGVSDREGYQLAR